MRGSGRRLWALWLVPGYAFLYLPLALAVPLSFNDSRLVTRWTGFSWRWYGTLWQDAVLIDAALLSFRIAVLSATMALALGTLAGLALARFGRFRGRGAFVAGLSASLVMPDVVAGLMLLLLFVTLEQITGWPAGRGTLTVTLAHASLSVAYVAAVVQARLAEMPLDLEEAAADLYAPPAAVFLRVTAPLLAPALLSGWLLAFTLSLDDVVVASFTSGPGASTLPMVVFSQLRLGPTPEINALATVVIGAVTFALAAGGVLRRYGRRRHVMPGERST
ncbi:MAG: ABC transporter permease subunit [Acetobacteraceae bacterium]|nr:ABC transporter permease subunit [Acetobacteraceae bacterium]